MDDIKRIIIPVDNTQDSKNAVKKGVFLAKLLGVKVKIITVNDTYHFISSVVLEEKLKKEAEVFLENFKKIGEEFGITLETQLVVGKPAEEIIKNVKEDDLLIMAYHEKTKGINSIFDRSVSIDVIRNAPCSVLIIKSK
ncbi:MAG: universal stress protein [Candidatus Thermoplasmatota archaeon]|jgi:nucleotide-binding universal stress UspA family protein|nr:universal stress protein [Candidatus Thermoplasmatota archaeon]